MKRPCRAYNPKLTALAQKNRKNPTPAETLLWQKVLRHRQFEAHKFHRQKPIGTFIVEMGDKTQIATVALAAKYAALGWVVAGTTAGMMLANAPVVYFGDKLTKIVPIKVVHSVCALIFVALGLAALLNLGDML